MPLNLEELKVPYAAQSDGRLVTAKEAAKGPWTCPGCREHVSLRPANKRTQAHFTHSNANCSPETMLHFTAKKLIEQAVNDRASRGRQIQLLLGDCECGVACSPPLPAIFKAAKCEERTPSDHRFDVALLSERAVLLAGVEVRVTNAVSEDKWRSEELPMAELLATEVLDDPYTWRVVRASRKAKCAECTELDRAMESIGVPKWVKKLRPYWGEDWVTEIYPDGNRIRLVAFNRTHREAFIDMHVAELRSQPSIAEWRRAAPETIAAARLAQTPSLPAYMTPYFMVREAIDAFGGSWLPRAENGEWTTQTAPEDRFPKLRRIASRTGQELPAGRNSPYWAEPYRCYRCCTEMVVYTWKGHYWMDDKEPPAPRPASIRYRGSKQAGGRYWANVCPKCDALQGENFVYKPEGPLSRHFGGMGTPGPSY